MVSLMGGFFCDFDSLHAFPTDYDTADCGVRWCTDDVSTKTLLSEENTTATDFVELLGNGMPPSPSGLISDPRQSCSVSPAREQKRDNFLKRHEAKSVLLSSLHHLLYSR